MEAKNQAAEQPLLNLMLARTYLAGRMLTRTWTEVFAQFAARGRETSQDRSRRAAASHDFDPIRAKSLIETTAARAVGRAGQRLGRTLAALRNEVVIRIDPAMRASR